MTLQARIAGAIRELLKEVGFTLFLFIFMASPVLLYLSISLRLKEIDHPDELLCETYAVSKFAWVTVFRRTKRLEIEIFRPPLTIRFGRLPQARQLHELLSRGENLSICYPRELLDGVSNQERIVVSKPDIYRIGTGSMVLMSQADFQDARQTEKRDTLYMGLIGGLLTWSFAGWKSWRYFRARRIRLREAGPAPVRRPRGKRRRRKSA